MQIAARRFEEQTSKDPLRCRVCRRPCLCSPFHDSTGHEQASLPGNFSHGGTSGRMSGARTSLAEVVSSRLVHLSLPVRLGKPTIRVSEAVDSGRSGVLLAVLAEQ